MTPQNPEESAPKVMSLYEFEFRLLPFLMNEVSKGSIPALGVVNKLSLMAFVEGNCDEITWKWPDFRCEGRTVDGTQLLLYWFPEPEEAPLARFAAGVLSKRRVNYYTLEIDDYGGRTSWHLCAQDTETHATFGVVEECKTMEEFIALLMKKGMLSGGKKGFLSGLFKKK